MQVFHDAFFEGKIEIKGKLAGALFSSDCRAAFRRLVNSAIDPSYMRSYR